MRGVRLSLTAREYSKQREEKLRDALEGAHEFIERVEGWTGGDEGEADEILDTIGRALTEKGDHR